MDKKSLIYGGVLAGSSITFIIWVSTFNHTQAQTQVLVQDLIQTQTQPSVVEHNNRHPKGSLTAALNLDSKCWN